MTLQEKLERYRLLRMDADELEAEIRKEVAEMASTVEIDGIKATYSEGRKTYKYEDAGKAHADEHIICKHTKPVTDWRAVCKDAGLINVPFTQGEPSVSIKISDKVEDIW